MSFFEKCPGCGNRLGHREGCSIEAARVREQEESVQHWRERQPWYQDQQIEDVLRQKAMSGDIEAMRLWVEHQKNKDQRPRSYIGD